MNNRLTITMPYYDAPEMLLKQIESWQQYPEWVTECVSVIIVDDGSPNHPAVDILDEIDSKFPLSLYRIEENIPWNHGGARNLAFTQMQEGWTLLTDIDHVLPLEGVCSLLTKHLREYCIYIPSRYQVSGVLDWEEISPHSDSFVLTREMFWQVGGFDEDFSGYWNGVSHLFRRHLLKLSDEVIVMENVDLHFYDNTIIKDANVESLGRKGSVYDIKNNPRLFNKMSNRLNKNYKPKDQLRFSWTQVI